MELKLLEGQIWWATPSPTVGREQAGRRPVVIVSGREYHDTFTGLALVVPVTTRDRGWPNHVRLTGRTGLDEPSWAMTEQVRAVSRDRLRTCVGLVDLDCLDVVRRWLVDYVR